MIKEFFHLFMPTLLATSTTVFLTHGVQSQTLDIGRNTNPSMKISGTSGGSVDSKGCGFIAKSPNQIVNVVDRLDYLRLQVNSNGGKPTLLIKGPGKNDRFCALADGLSSDNPEISGVWTPGLYYIYVGDLKGEQHSYTLNISK
jgi:hypothetical protein